MSLLVGERAGLGFSRRQRPAVAAACLCNGRSWLRVIDSAAVDARLSESTGGGSAPT